MNLETTTVYTYQYDNMCESLNAKSYDLATLQGRILGLSEMADEHPDIVAKRIIEIAKEIRAEAGL